MILSVVLLTTLSMEAGGRALFAGRVAPVQAATANAQADQNSYCREISATDSRNASLLSVCEFALSLRQKLPKFICDETITRYRSTPWGAEGNPTDVISAEVTFENGHDSYRNISLNRKPRDLTLLELSGMSSIGEFGGLLQAIFDPTSRAEFKFRKERKLRSRPALLFEFRVAMRNNKLWWLGLRNSVICPGYEGVLWLDEDTSELMRIEVHATEVPAGFAISEAQTRTDYGEVRFSNGSKFPLPVWSETKTRLYRDPSFFRNEIRFKDCREFGATHRFLP